MRVILVTVTFLCLSSVNCSLDVDFSVLRSQVKPKYQKKAAQGVLTRLIGEDKAKLFELKIESNNENKDWFRMVKTDEEKILVSGPNGLSLAWGVHYYLKNFCNCHISWDGDQLNIPSHLPFVNVSVVAIDSVRFYQNACTSSYSFVWWDWKRWEREIDWMALNGINLALASTAQEAIWERVVEALNLSSNDLTGPAFLAWYRMGNLRNFGDGLSSDWHQDQLYLQHKILKRMRELGIVPVLPAFCGVVPRSFKTAFPFSNLTKMSQWSRFSDDYCCPYLVGAQDPLFKVVSHLFMREYLGEFGTNHMYSCDTFNENSPSSGDLNYLKNISEAIYTEMNAFDPDAMWLMQGWMFIDPFWESKEKVKSFLDGVPKGRLIILDLQSDLTPQYKRLESFFGHLFVWCMLHNFGGQLGMYGHLDRINKGIITGRTFKNSTMVGIGITPEGIDQNYVMYEFALESTFRNKPTNLSEWVSQYALRRYGNFNEAVKDAWLILKDTVYNYRPEMLYRINRRDKKQIELYHGEHISKNILTKLPSLRLNDLSWYNRSKIYDVFEKFIIASKDININSSELFQHDFIDISRQTIQIVISILYFEIIEDYFTNDYEGYRMASKNFLKILDELDIILGSGKKFLLGKWLESAKKKAKTENENIRYQFNARNQITLWGPNGEIRDYAAKQWSGLISDYYKPRWAVFFEELSKSLSEHTPYDNSLVKNRIFQSIEKPFGEKTNIYPTEPNGNTNEIIQDFNQRWGATFWMIFHENEGNGV